MMLIFLLGILFVTFLWNRYFLNHWDKGLNMDLHFAETFVYAGEKAHLMERIENPKVLPLPAVEIGFQMRKELVFSDLENTTISDFTHKRDIFSLLGNQRITRTLEVNATKRGHYQIEKMEVRAHSLFFNHTYTISFPVNTTLYVYAKRVQVKGIVDTCEKIMGELQCEKRLLEDPFAFSSIREYHITDPMKSINWKASAKTGDLMVNTMESSLTRRVMIYLDVEDGGIMKFTNLIEEGIALSATLAQKMLNRSMELGFTWNDETVLGSKLRLEPKSGKQQHIFLEQLLAEHHTRGTCCPFEDILVEPTRDTLCVVISKNREEKNQRAIEQFLGKNRGIWIVPVDIGVPLSLSVKKNIKVIRREVE